MRCETTEALPYMTERRRMESARPGPILTTGSAVMRAVAPSRAKIPVDTKGLMFVVAIGSARLAAWFKTSDEFEESDIIRNLNKKKKIEMKNIYIFAFFIITDTKCQLTFVVNLKCLKCFCLISPSTRSRSLQLATRLF